MFGPRRRVTTTRALTRATSHRLRAEHPRATCLARPGLRCERSANEHWRRTRLRHVARVGAPETRLDGSQLPHGSCAYETRGRSRQSTVARIQRRRRRAHIWTRRLHPWPDQRQLDVPGRAGCRHSAVIAVIMAMRVLGAVRRIQRRAVLVLGISTVFVPGVLAMRRVLGVLAMRLPRVLGMRTSTTPRGAAALPLGVDSAHACFACSRRASRDLGGQRTDLSGTDRQEGEERSTNEARREATGHVFSILPCRRCHAKFRIRGSLPLSVPRRLR